MLSTDFFYLGVGLIDYSSKFVTSYLQTLSVVLNNRQETVLGITIYHFNTIVLLMIGTKHCINNLQSHSLCIYGAMGQIS